jgi:hypothetical protein
VCQASVADPRPDRNYLATLHFATALFRIPSWFSVKVLFLVKSHVFNMARKNPEQSRLPSVSPQLLPTQPPNNNPMDYGAVSRRQNHVTKKFVLCFDGTGNKFSGTDSDSNILKIYRMLDRNGDDQFHYYQPGIGTYVTKANGSMTRTGRWEKFQSWYAKAKDSAIGMFDTPRLIYVRPNSA